MENKRKEHYLNYRIACTFEREIQIYQCSWGAYLQHKVEKFAHSNTQAKYQVKKFKLGFVVVTAYWSMPSCSIIHASSPINNIWALVCAPKLKWSKRYHILVYEPGSAIH